MTLASKGISVLLPPLTMPSGSTKSCRASSSLLASPRRRIPSFLKPGIFWPAPPRATTAPSAPAGESLSSMAGSIAASVQKVRASKRRRPLASPVVANAGLPLASTICGEAAPPDSTRLSFLTFPGQRTVGLASNSAIYKSSNTPDWPETLNAADAETIALLTLTTSIRAVVSDFSNPSGWSISRYKPPPPARAHTFAASALSA